MRAVAFLSIALLAAACGRRHEDERAKRVLDEEDGDVVDPPDPNPDPPTFLPPCLHPLRGPIKASTTIEGTLCVVGTLSIEHGATLTVAPGAHLLFGKGGALVVRDGALIAKGTAADPIVFTSIADTPAAGDWFGLVFANKTRTRSILQNVDLGYAGGDAPKEKRVGALVVVGSSAIDLGSMNIHDSGSKGLVMIAALGSSGGSITL